MEAARSGNKEIVRMLLEHGADINAIATDNETVFSYAAASGNKEIIQLLLDYGLVINPEEYDFSLALSAAAEKGHTEMLHFLLKHGTNRTGMHTALFSAAIAGNISTVKFLLDNGAAIGNDILPFVAENGLTDIAQILLDHGADINQPLDYGTDINHLFEKAGQTALIAAATAGQKDMILFLLEHGADVYAEDSRGNTALMIAKSKNHTSIVTLLEEWIKNHPR